MDGLEFSPRKIGAVANLLASTVKRGIQVPKDYATVRGAKAFLKVARAFEDKVLALLHILSGGTSRATDYKGLKLEDVIPLDEQFTLVKRSSNKNSLLRRVKVEAPIVVPTKLLGAALDYWKNQRKFLVEAADILGKDSGVWKTHCFVYSDEKKVRHIVSKALREVLGPEAKFQRLRHAAEAIFRTSIFPRELQLREAYSFDSLFSHSYKTGLSYGLSNLVRSSRREPVDISSTFRCLKAFWELIGVQVDQERKQEEVLEAEAVLVEEEDAGKLWFYLSLVWVIKYVLSCRSRISLGRRRRRRRRRRSR